MNVCSLRISIVLAHGSLSQSPLISQGSEDVHISHFEGIQSYWQDCSGHGLPDEK